MSPFVRSRSRRASTRSAWSTSRDPSPSAVQFQGFPLWCGACCWWSRCGLTGLLDCLHKIADPVGEHVHSDEIMAAFGDDNVGVTAARLDKFEVHRADGRQVLVNHGLDGAATLGNVALQTPDKTDI